MGTGFRCKNFQSSRKDPRQTRFILLGLSGLTCSLLTILFVVFYSRNAVEPSEQASNIAKVTVEGLGTVTVYTLERSIRAGSRLSEHLASFKPLTISRNDVPAEAIMDLSEIGNKYAFKDIPAGVPIVRSYLTKEETKRNALPVPIGMRAVTIGVTAEEGVEGWADPGKRVDVILTYMDDNETVSRVIVENSEILSVAGSVKAPNSGLGGRPSRELKSNTTITLATSPEDALSITNAKKLGDISLFLRNDTDKDLLNEGQKEMPASKLREDGDRKPIQSQARCQRGEGIIRIEGHDYVQNCDGTLSAVLNDAP